MSRTTIPDLRPHHNEFTVEHCSVLLERMAAVLKTANRDVDEDELQEVLDKVDAKSMQNDLLTIMEAERLCVMFETDIGKGMLIGIFWATFVAPLQVED